MIRTATRDVLAIEAFSVEDENCGKSDRHPIVYRHAELSRAGIRDQAVGSEDYARILLRIGADQTFDIVVIDLTQTGDLAALDRAIQSLDTVRVELAQLYGRRAHSPGPVHEVGRLGAVPMRRRPRGPARPPDRGPGSCRCPGPCRRSCASGGGVMSSVLVALREGTTLPEITCPDWCCISKAEHIGDLRELDGLVGYWSSEGDDPGASFALSSLTYTDGVPAPKGAPALHFVGRSPDVLTLEEAQSLARTLLALGSDVTGHVVEGVSERP